MSRVALRYSPGYLAAIRAWAACVWTLHRNLAGWLAFLAAVVTATICAGYASWMTWTGVVLLVLLSTRLSLPLAFRLVWAHKIRSLGVHELSIGEDGLEIWGKDVQLRSPWSLYEGYAEGSHHFFLTQPDGLFSFIPKGDGRAAQEVRGVLDAHLPKVAVPRRSGLPRLAPRMSTRLYVSLYLLLVAWFVLEGLRVSTTSVWLPLFGIAVLDRVLTRTISTQLLFSTFLMVAILFYAGIQFLAPPEQYGDLRYRVYEVLAFLGVFALHQVILWRLVLSRTGARVERAVPQADEPAKERAR